MLTVSALFETKETNGCVLPLSEYTTVCPDSCCTLSNSHSSSIRMCGNLFLRERETNENEITETVTKKCYIQINARI